MDITVGSIALEQKRIIHPVLQHVAGSKPFAEDKGIVNPGRVLSAIEGTMVPAGLTVGADMAGLVNGTNKVYTFSAGKPICPGSLEISHGSQVVKDDGFGSLQGDGTGVVHYDTGDVSVTLNSAPAESSGAPVIGLADDPEGIALDKVNTVGGAEESGLVLTIGAIISKEVNLGEDEVPGCMKARLRLKGIVFVQ